MNFREGTGDFVYFLERDIVRDRGSCARYLTASSRSKHPQVQFFFFFLGFRSKNIFDFIRPPHRRASANENRSDGAFLPGWSGGRSARWLQISGRSTIILFILSAQQTLNEQRSRLRLLSFIVLLLYGKKNDIWVYCG